MLLVVISVIGLLAFTLMNLVSSSGSVGGAASSTGFGVGVRMIQHNVDHRSGDDLVELSSRRLASLRSALSDSVVLVRGPDGTLNEIDLSNASASPEKKTFKSFNYVQNNFMTYRGVGASRNLSKGKLAEGKEERVFKPPRYEQGGGGQSFTIANSLPEL